MLCKQRQGSLLMLRSMRRPPTIVWVYREKRWQEITSLDVVPGDVLSLSTEDSKRRSLILSHHRQQQQSQQFGVEENIDTENVVPCDLLLIRGSCVVNEAMLTGSQVFWLHHSCFILICFFSHIHLCCLLSSHFFRR